MLIGLFRNLYSCLLFFYLTYSILKKTGDQMDCALVVLISQNFCFMSSMALLFVISSLCIHYTLNIRPYPSTFHLVLLVLYSISLETIMYTSSLFISLVYLYLCFMLKLLFSFTMGKFWLLTFTVLIDIIGFIPSTLFIHMGQK